MDSELSAQLATDEAELAENRTLLAERAARASSLREEMASLSGDVERLRSFLQQSETNLGDLVQRIESGHAQIASPEQEASEQQAMLDEQAQGLDAARNERNRLRDRADPRERDRP